MLGEDPEAPGKFLAYVGESEALGDRLGQHDRDDVKPYWETTFIVSSKDANLTKAHIRYLEARLVRQIVQANRVRAMNGTLTTSSSLTRVSEINARELGAETPE